jgi:large subunit ribosomal protein L33
MAKKKSRIINVRLISMAMTGFFYNFKRPRVATPMGMLKYDPIGAFTCPWSPRRLPWLCVPRTRSNSNLALVRKKVLFLESKKRVR